MNQKSYLLDTSVLLHDSEAIYNFEDKTYYLYLSGEFVDNFNEKEKAYQNIVQ